MALGLDSDCPHCPPTDHAADVRIITAITMPMMPIPAAIPSSGCGEADEFSLDGRFSYSKAKDKFDDNAIAASPLVQ